MLAYEKLWIAQFYAVGAIYPSKTKSSSCYHFQLRTRHRLHCLHCKKPVHFGSIFMGGEPQVEHFRNISSFSEHFKMFKKCSYWDSFLQCRQVVAGKRGIRRFKANHSLSMLIFRFDALRTSLNNKVMLCRLLWI